MACGSTMWSNCRRTAARCGFSPRTRVAPDLEDSASLRELRAQESAAGLADLATYSRFAERVEECRRSLLAFLAAAKREGKTVAAYGAAAKGNTLLNFCAVTPADISQVADRNPHKQSKFLPGTHIPVVSPEALMQARPDYVLILPWNLQEEIRQQLQGIKEWGGRFVTPVPMVRIYPRCEAGGGGKVP